MRIAVVGAGISGLTAAYLLSRAHEVELFERNDYAGGHANTVAVREDGVEVGLDAGFVVYNEHTYPGFTKLLRELDVATQPGEMSLSVRCAACRLEYSSRGLRGMLARRRDLARPSRWMLGLDILRFYRDTRHAVESSEYERATLAEFLRARRYSGEFVRHFIVPVASAVWSTPSAEIDSFPVRHFLRFLLNHGIIGLQPAHVWRTVRGGSREYVRRMTEALPAVRLSAPVRRVWREADGARLAIDGAGCRTFDRVVLACHADEALALLADASEEERQALGGFSYSSHRVALHTDASLLPEREAARAAWNYATRDCRRDGRSLMMTYHLNRLQALRTPTDYCVSLNAERVRPETVIREMTYEHPRYTFETLAAQRAVLALDGARHTHFAGAYLGYGFHEDGYASGARVAASIGADARVGVLVS
ncbi:MAG: FAD-dependent oxidoreductase [Dehalococcoidia bacterium]